MSTVNCPACGGANPDSHRFCSQCGAMLPEQAVGVEKEDSEELRKVTAIFSDLSGYTAMAERLGPEETKGITSRIFSEAAAIAKKYEGRLDRLVGDCALILFGIPLLHEDDAVRALLTAMELHRYVESLNSAELVARIGRPLTMQTGVNTGTVLAGETDFETGVETVVGDAVNLASRLKDAARPGQILVGPLCWRHTAEAFEYRELEALHLKGKKKPVQAYELLSRKSKQAQVRPEGLSREVHSPLVGRERELKLLEGLAQKAAAGEGSIVFVRAEAGVGKSRLLAELRGKDFLEGMLCLEGSAQSIGKSLSFHPFIEMLDGWAGIREDDGERETCRKLESAVREAAQEKAGEIFPFLAVLRGIGLEGSYADRVNEVARDAMPKLVAKGFRDLLRILSRKKPLILFLEDLHWADQSSLELLEGLFRIVGKERACFVAALRPSEPNTGKLIRDAHELYGERSVLIDLPALSADESQQMIYNLLKSRAVSKSILDPLVERAGGNPFFIEEIVRSWVDEGAVRVTKEGFQIAEYRRVGDIPYTINQAIMARIDRLGEETKKVLRIAAVIGRSFFYRIIAHLAENVGSLDSKIDYLKGIQLIVERRRLDEVEYLFKHALVQKVIYDSLLVQVRKKLHAGVAQAIETIFSERLPEFYGLLAYHYGQSGEEEKVEHYLALAGEEALKIAASSEARAFLTQALEMYLRTKAESIDPRQAAQLLRSIAMAHSIRGENKEAIRYFREALSYLGIRLDVGGPQRMLGALTGLVGLLLTVYFPLRRRRRPASRDDLFVIDIEYQESRRHLLLDPKDFAFAILSMFRHICRYDVSTIPNGTRTYCEVSGLFSMMGFHGIAKRIIEYSTERMNESEIRDKFILDNCRLWHGLFSGCRPFYYDREVRNATARIGDYYTYGLFLWTSGVHEIETGDLEYGAMLIREASALSEEIDHLEIRFWAIAVSLFLNLKKRLYEDVINGYGKYKQILEAAVSATTLVVTRSLITEAEIMSGDLGEAEKILWMNRESLRRSGFVPPPFCADHVVASFHLGVVRLGKAIASRDITSARALRRECRKFGWRAVSLCRVNAPTRVQTYRYMGTWHWLINSPKRAFKWWARSIDEGERLGYRVELSRTYCEIGFRLRAASSSFRAMRGIDSDGYLARAENLFREIGLEKDLEMLHEFRGQPASWRTDCGIDFPGVVGATSTRPRNDLPELRVRQS
jgi:class 3 adenylate cyclase/tetratricopeptide (TPR) repeat protein